MAADAPSYRWMATLLDLLIERYDEPTAASMLKDFQERRGAIRELNPDLTAAGMPAGMMNTPEGQSLLVAILALRLRFPADEARQKVELNIAMREGASPPRP